MATAPARDWAVFASRLGAEWLADDPTRLHRRLSGSLVSADLSGFTAMSERFAAEGRRGAELLTDVVNGCFTTLIDAAAREGGDVLKFGGDALLIWFPGQHAAVRAARASARMQRALAAPRFARAGLRMSVGAHTGEFDYFLVGEPDWRELVLLGEPVTRTVQLESDAEPGQVLVSEATAAGLPAEWLESSSGGHAVLDLDQVPLPRRPVPGPPAWSAEALVAPNLREDIRALATLGGEHRLASITFLEIEGTDRTLERFGPEVISGRLDDLIRATQQISREYGVQFLYTDVIANGLKLIATAGAPATTANDEESALRYALDFVHGDPYMKLKCGVNRGRVFAGFLGSESRRTYTVMGDPVNLAARLMAHARPGEVVAASDVIREIRAEVRSQELPPFLVKGKVDPITAVVVEAISDEQRTAPSPVELPLVGREDEVARLRGLVAALAEGHGHAVELVGDAGVGKSRLVGELAGDERIFQSSAVECQPYARNTAYAAAKGLLRRVLGVHDGASTEEAGDALRRTVSRAVPGLLPLLPLIAVPVDAVVDPTPEVEAIAPDFVVARTHDAILELLSVMLPTPTLLLVEDAYYVDAASAALFNAMARGIDTRPWLFVATTRPGVGMLLTEAPGLTRIHLEPLAATAAAELAALALRGAPGISADLAAAAQRAGGNPLFVLRLMEAVRAGVATDDLPESIERIVAERLDRLAPRDRTLLRYAAVLGPRFDADLLAQVLATTGQPAADAGIWERVDDLVEVDGAAGRRFRHLLYRDVAYEGIPFARRGRLHQRIGELLEASRYASDVALLAEHFFRAGDHERTWRYSVAAGDRAWQQLAVDEAAVAYRRALQVRRWVRGLSGRESARVAEALGDVLERTAAFESADRAYLSASRTSNALSGGGSGVDVRLMLKRGVLRERVGKYQAALRWYERGRRVADSAQSEISDAPLLVASAGVMDRLGRLEESAQFAMAAADRAVIAHDRGTEAHARLLLTLWDLGAEQARSHGLRALELFTTLGNVLYQGKVHNNLGVVEYFEANWPAAAAHYGSAIEFFDAAGDVVEAASARNNLGEVLSDQGRLSQAILLFEGALAEWSRASYPIGVALARSNLGRAQARAGRSGEATANLRRSEAEFEEIGANRFAVDTRLRIAEALLLVGDTTAARRTVDVVAEEVRSGGGYPGSEATVERLRCWLLRQTGDDAGALAHARAGAELAEASGLRIERILSMSEEAHLSGDPEIAAEVSAELAALDVIALPALPLPL